jgi:hypothetical protein
MRKLMILGAALAALLILAIPAPTRSFGDATAPIQSIDSAPAPALAPIPALAPAPATAQTQSIDLAPAPVPPRFDRRTTSPAVYEPPAKPDPALVILR